MWELRHLETGSYDMSTYTFCKITRAIFVAFTFSNGIHIDDVRVFGIALGRDNNCGRCAS